MDYYWIDPSSTAEYGVDYKMSGGQFDFYPNIAPTPAVRAMARAPQKVTRAT